METTTKGSHWSITINNPAETDRQALKDHPTFVKKVVCQDEVGDNGTLHIQGYVQTTQTRFSALKKWLPRAHIEIAKNPQALLQYVRKEETAVAGTQQEHKNEYLSMDKALLRVARAKDLIQFEMNFEKYMENPKKEIKREFWACVCHVLADQPEAVGLFTNPQLERAWINTRDVWINLYSKSKVLEENAPRPEVRPSQEAESPPSAPCDETQDGVCDSEADSAAT